MGDLVDRLQYGYTASAKAGGEGPLFLRITDLQEEGIDWDAVPRCDASAAVITKYALHDGDIVFARTGSIEKASIVRNPPRAVFASYLIRGRPVRPELSDWIGCFVRSRHYLEQIGAVGVGIGRKNINAKKLGAVRVPIAPEAEQRRIMAKLDELLAGSRAAHAALDAIPALLEHYKKAVLAAAFNGTLTADWRALHPRAPNVTSILDADPMRRGRVAPALPRPDDVPESWGWERLGTLGLDPTSAVQTGPFGAQLHSGEFVSDGVPVIAVGNLTGIGFTTHGLYYVTPDKAAALARYDVHAGDLLFARSGATLGKVCVAPTEVRDWRMTGHILRVRLSERLIDPHFVAYALWGDPRVKQQVVGGIRGMTRPGYNTALLEAIAVAVPPRDEQNVLVARIREAFQRLDAVEQVVNGLARRLSGLEQATLAKAFRGGLVQQHAVDEPATAFLTRLGAEHARVPQSRRHSRA